MNFKISTKLQHQYQHHYQKYVRLRANVNINITRVCQVDIFNWKGHIMQVLTITVSLFWTRQDIDQTWAQYHNERPLIITTSNYFMSWLPWKKCYRSLGKQKKWYFLLLTASLPPFYLDFFIPARKSLLPSSKGIVPKGTYWLRRKHFERIWREDGMLAEVLGALTGLQVIDRRKYWVSAEAESGNW